MTKKKFIVPARHEISVVASGLVTIMAESKEEALQKIKELTEDKDEFCFHIRESGDTDSFDIDPSAVGEAQHECVKSGAVEYVQFKVDEIEEN